MTQQPAQAAIRLIRPKQAWQGVELFCTTRQGGVGQTPYDTFNLGLGAQEDPASVHENRKRLQQLLPAEPAWLQQVHGNRVVDADDAQWFDASLPPPAADASVTAQPGRVLAVLTADCLSVVLADQAGSVLGVAHAGWKGLAAGVLEATLQKMQSKRPSASGWRAWVGPGIGAKAFQVGDPVGLQAFEAGLAGVDDGQARGADVVGAVAGAVGKLGRDDRLLALGANGGQSG